jgi:hypothetical protein
MLTGGSGRRRTCSADIPIVRLSISEVGPGIAGNAKNPLSYHLLFFPIV